jgi:hypothetical protein
VSREAGELLPWHCLFCRMRVGVKLFRIPVCAICRDQLHDFVWASAIQGVLALVGVIGGFQFAIEEVALFAILVLVKHRLPSLLDRFVQNA